MPDIYITGIAIVIDDSHTAGDNYSTMDRQVKNYYPMSTVCYVVPFTSPVN